MANSLLALAVPSLMLVPAMGLLSLFNSSRDVGNELKRKALHVTVGLTALSFPIFLSTPWLVCTATCVALAWMIAVRKLPSLRRQFGACLHDTQRVSFGEIYFALAIGVLLLLTVNRPLLYVIPLLIVTLADTAAAIVGRLFPAGPLTGIASGKTISGSAAFLVVAVITTYLTLYAFTNMSFPDTAGIALVVGGVSCLAEAISKRGLDNVFVPAVAYVALLFFDIPQIAGNASVAHLLHDLSARVMGA